jgi:ABC-type nitrate/sulfonate/bicarbonate transport system ATPase subunit
MHGPTLHPHKTAFDNILFPLTVRGVSLDVGRKLAQSASERARFPAERLHAAPESLSAGEAQRAVIARMLARHATVALLDEPFAHLDPTLRRTLGHEVRRALFSSDDPACMISVTHDWDDLQDDDIAPKKVLILNRVDDDRSEHRICSVADARTVLRTAAVIDFTRVEGVA